MGHAAHHLVAEREEGVAEQEDRAHHREGERPGEPQERVVEVPQRPRAGAEDADLVAGARVAQANRWAVHARRAPRVTAADARTAAWPRRRSSGWDPGP